MSVVDPIGYGRIVGHPVVANKTSYAFEPLQLLDEEAHPILTVLFKGTFAIGPNGDCRLAAEQAPVTLTGEAFGEDPASSSLKYEPEVAFFKPATDVVMNGHAYAPRVGTTEMVVSLSVGPVHKEIRVSGERAWYRAAGRVGISRTAPFEKMPLQWERAFGGWDRGHQDPRQQICDARNPVGLGFRPSGTFEDDLLLPNLETPGQLLRAFGERPEPAGFGFVSPHWQPRASLAGTYDQRWRQERSPRLPRDFSRQHFNAAPPDQIVAGYLRGDERVTVTGVTPSPRGTLSFDLPGHPPPAVRIVVRNGIDQRTVTKLDTIIVEPDQMRVLLLWRAHVAGRAGFHDVVEIHAAAGATAV